MAPPPHVIVCGAGLTGLTTAWHLRRQGVHVTVIEAGHRVGGVIQSTRRDGYLVEHGPNSCTLTPELASLIEALGLTPQLRPAAPEAQRRYIVRDGIPLEVPTSPGAMLTSPLFGLSAKLRVLREPWVARRTAPGDESVADFVRRRLGTEPLTFAVDPFVSGVYAGDPEALSVAHAFPRLAAMERDHGSLVRAMIASGRRARVARSTGAGASARHTMVSFTNGLHTLPAALAVDIGTANIRLDTRVVAIESRAAGVAVTVQQGDLRHTLAADLVVSTLPLHALAHIGLPPGTDAAIAQLQTVPYPAVASLALGFRRADVAHALDGFGCLVPSREGRKTLGVLFSSTLFEGRAPEGYVLLTCFLGGTRYPGLGVADTATLLSAVEPDLAELFGIAGVPKFVEHTVWPRAIPQYNVGHDANLRAAEALETIVPGLLVDGQFRRGVSVGDCVAAGASIATRAATAAARAAATRPTPHPTATLSAEHEILGVA
jgi:oxygen-dependent protoporphyrinogen oxidase